MIIVILILAAILFIYFNVIPGKGHTLISWLSLIVIQESCHLTHHRSCYTM